MSPPDSATELPASALRRVCDPAALGFAATDAVDPLSAHVGQERADEAIAFGLEADLPGYNVFATGPVGTGKRTALEAAMRRVAASAVAPGDIVYVHNFRDPTRPIAVTLATGAGRELAADMRRFLADARRELTAAFESETYAERQRQATEPLDHAQEAALAELRERARAGGIAVELTPAGIMTVPLRGVHPMSPQEFSQLPEAVRARYQASVEQLQPQLQAFVARMRALQREGREALRVLEREVGLFAVGHLIDELKERHRESDKLVAWFDAVAEDVIENLPQFQAAGGEQPQGSQDLLAAIGRDPDAVLARYQVNQFVSHELDGGAPVIVETNPTYANLFGRIEHHGVLGGGFVTDHRLLRAGAVHRANGGYLMLPAAEVFSQPLVWPKLKAVLRAGAIRLENPAEQYALIPSASLAPEAIGLDLKVVLVGSPQLYALAYAIDEDVRRLFRVKAEFDWRAAWDGEAERGYAAFLSSRARSDGIRHFDAGGVARMVEHGARLAESQEWLSTSFSEIAALAGEASYLAAREERDLVGAEHVERAIERKIRRSDLVERRLLDMVAEGALLLDFDGERIGQINGLAVLDLGDYAFGRPVRITASAGPGRGALVSIEREAELSGHIHDKGFLTLSGYLRRRYGADRRIALGATLTFEQSYDQIDGDSAACAELYTLLSAIAGVPLRQDIAVTGSVNQNSEVQAIGGVNEKIEGFFRACSLAGLTGAQGVLIPAANARHLMLHAEVTEAVSAGRFHVWTATRIDEGLALLTGRPAEAIHARVEERLTKWEREAEPPAPAGPGARPTEPGDLHPEGGSS